MNSINKLSLFAVAANAAPQFGPNFPFGNGNPFGPNFPFGNNNPYGPGFPPNNNPGATTTTPAVTPRPTCAGAPFVIPGQVIQGFTFPPYVTIPAFTIPDRTLTLSGVCAPTPGLPGVTTTTSITLPTTTTSITLPTTTSGGLPLPTDTLVAIGENGELFSFNIQKGKAIAGDVISSVILEPGTILPDIDLPVDLPIKARRQVDIGAAAVQECANLCAGVEACEAFQTFVNDQDEQQCDLKNNLGPLSDLIGSVVGFKGDEIIPGVGTTTTTTTTSAATTTTTTTTGGITLPTDPVDVDDELPTDLPVDELPTDLPVDELPTDLPVDELPIDLPVGELPTDLPVDELPVDELPTDLPVDELPTDELPVDELPVDELPTDELPVDELPVDEIPTDELPVDELPVDELPVDELPTDELPIDLPLPGGL